MVCVCCRGGYSGGKGQETVTGPCRPHSRSVLLQLTYEVTLRWTPGDRDRGSQACLQASAVPWPQRSGGRHQMWDPGAGGTSVP